MIDFVKNMFRQMDTEPITNNKYDDAKEREISRLENSINYLVGLSNSGYKSDKIDGLIFDLCTEKIKLELNKA